MFDLRKDIVHALKKHTTLALDNSSMKVSGRFVAYNSEQNVEIEEYEVAIVFSDKYPFRFPSVEEISNKIPKDPSRHIKPDGTICFANPQDELAVCRNGISFDWFLDEVLNAHLCREYAREKLGYYPTGERSHGIEGIWEGYYEIFGTTDKQTILTELALVHRHIKVGRNAACYCSSGIKYKKCHQQIEYDVFKIGDDYAVQLFQLLKNDYQKNETN